MLSFLLSGCYKKIDIIQEITDIEVGSDIDYQTLISSDQEIEIVMKSSTVDNSKVGEYQVTYEISSGKNKVEKSININIIDTTPPVIKKKKTKIEYGSDIDLLDEKYISVSDLGDPDPTLEVVDGAVYTNIPGDHTVKYKASDHYGNVQISDVVYHVKEKEYTLGELVDLAKERADGLIADGCPIKYEEDEFVKKIMVSYKDVDLLETDSKAKVMSYPTFCVNEEGIYFGFVTVPMSQEIFSGADKFYLKSDRGQYENEYLDCGMWDYDFPYFHTLVIGPTFDDDSYKRLDIETIIDIFQADSVKFRLTGSFTVDATYPQDMNPATIGMAKLFLELCELRHSN